MVSIVLPVYNGEKYLRESIESIINQTYQDWELIIVNDCSTDNSEIIAKEYADKDSRIVVVSNSVNSKLPKSLNNGFKIARGEYFTWTSDDNLFKENAIEKMVTCLGENPDVDIVYSYYDLIDSSGNIKDADAQRQSLKMHDIDYIDKHPNTGIMNFVGACFLYKNSVHYKLDGYDETLFLVEDFDFWLRARRYFTYMQLKECLYLYRHHENALSSTRRRDIDKKTIEVVQREIDLGYVESERIAGCYYDFLHRLYAMEDYNSFKKYYDMLVSSEHEGIRIDCTYRIARYFGIKSTRVAWKMINTCKAIIVKSKGE